MKIVRGMDTHGTSSLSFQQMGITACGELPWSKLVGSGWIRAMNETEEVKSRHETAAEGMLPGASPRVTRIRRLRRSELPHGTIALARFLIGKLIVHDLPEGRVSGRIVETEAYPPGDPAGHHFRGPTPRIRSMYLPHGHVYVFFNYGAHFMLNVVSEPPKTAAAILIRALEPIEGIELMRRHRNTTRLLDLTRGPGRLASALRIDRRHDGLDLCGPGSLWLGTIDRTAGPVGKSVRIGISRAADKLLRFYERGNPFVSGPKRLLLPLSLPKKISARRQLARRRKRSRVR